MTFFDVAYIIVAFCNMVWLLEEKCLFWGFGINQERNSHSMRLNVPR